jgi:hypothetical protein
VREVGDVERENGATMKRLVKVEKTFRPRE